MKHYWFAVVTKYPDEKFIAYASSVAENQNIRHRWDDKDSFGGEVIIVHPCPSKKYCETLCNEWNKTYLNNGTFHQF